MDLFIQLVIAGIARGSLIGLVSVGVVVVFSSTRLLNFAAGEFAMLGGLIGSLILVTLDLPYVVAVIAVIAGGALYGVIVQAGVVGPLTRRGVQLIPVVIALLGVSILTAQAAQTLVGPTPRSVPSPWTGAPLQLGGIFLARHFAVMALAAVFAVGVFTAIRRYTSLGLALRAVGANRAGAQVSGLNVRQLERGAFALAGGVSAFAGLFVAPLTGWRPTMGLEIALLAFIAAIVGGITNPFSAFAGALLIGVTSVFIETYVSALYGQTILFGVLILAVLLRPTGLIPSREAEAGALRV